MAQEDTFFEYAAEAGLTKHLGGTEATDTMIEFCKLGSDSYMLDVGCGVGQTACYIASKYGCRVVGIDIIPKMVERSWERAKKEGLTDLVEFRVGDAQDLPFDDAIFDAVITESVTAFPEDKLKAVSEYVRVTKPGGFVGLNESTWLKMPPPPEMIEWVSQDIGSTVKPLPAAEWQSLMVQAGLKEIWSQILPVETQQEAKRIVARYGMGHMLKSMLRAGRLYLRNPNYRKFVKEVNQGGIAPENITEFFGYGIYIGSK
jgi:ubiquinone/menaquinone biosynthesis C-methylase UbiE